ncbi:MAG: DUF4359 domain-containing protein [Microcystis sp.]
MGGNFFKGAIALGVIAGIMGFTNPPQELYSEYAAKKLLAHADKIACEKISLCGSIDSLPVAARNVIKNQILKPAIETSSQRQNLGVFSIYTTEVPGVAKIRTIGAFGHFLTFSET